MTKTRMLIALFAVAAATQAAVPLSAVQQQRASPHETVNATVADAKISIIYGRPNAKGRPIFGKLVPWGTAWRAGADEATTLVTDKALDFGGTNVPAGKYTLYLIPEEKSGSKLAISKTVGKWGIPVDTKNDLAQVDAKMEAVGTKVEQFTIAIDKAGNGGVIKMTWENTQFSVPFEVKK
jgi:Protein of unknown function (DUF2911)